MLIEGRCHCGNIAFHLLWPAAGPDIPARACGCTFCSKHAGVWTSSPQAKLRVSIRAPGEVSAYRFGTRSASFHVCRRCGVVPLVSSTIDGRLYAVVNVHAFTNVDPASIRPAPASFEDEDRGARLARRSRSWIADVAFEPPASEVPS